MIERKLSSLKEGERGIVVSVEAAGMMRRRLLDLGVISGTEVTCEHKSPSGDPVAYMIRGALIALRNKDAGDITVYTRPAHTGR